MITNGDKRRDRDADTVRWVVLGGLAGYLGIALLILTVSLANIREDERALAENARVIEVVATEFAFEPKPIELERGETVRLVVENRGRVPHEFRLTTQADIDEHLAHDHVEEEHVDGPGLIYLEVGETKELLWTSRGRGADVNRAVCLLPGHYELGMVVDVVGLDDDIAGDVDRDRE